MLSKPGPVFQGPAWLRLGLAQQELRTNPSVLVAMASTLVDGLQPSSVLANDTMFLPGALVSVYIYISSFSLFAFLSKQDHSSLYFD